MNDMARKGKRKGKRREGEKVCPLSEILNRPLVSKALFCQYRDVKYLVTHILHCVF